MENLLFEKALGIKKPWFVKEIKFNQDQKQLDIYIDFKRGAIFEYEEEGKFKAYDKIEKQWRHLNFFEHECYLHAKVPRVKLPNGKVKLVKTPWEGESFGFTLLFEALLLTLVKNMPVHTTGKLVKENDNKIWDMMRLYVKKARKMLNLKNLNKVGIDETSRKKGHNYITLFVDLMKRTTVFITEGKDHSTVEKFRKDLEKHKGRAKNIKQVSMDMSKSFQKGVRENLKEAKVTYDKFHILKIINEAVDQVRKEEAQTSPILKNSRYSFLKNESNLKKREKEKLEELSLSGLNLKTMRAKHIRDNFQEVYNADTKEEFESLLKKWYFWSTHSRIEPIIRVAKTIKRHWDGIIAWKESNINNGILEGLNSIIQAAKSKARGYRSTKNFKTMAYLLTANLDFSKINRFYLPT